MAKVDLQWELELERCSKSIPRGTQWCWRMFYMFQTSALVNPDSSRVASADAACGLLVECQDKVVVAQLRVGETVL